ncbi:peroxide stress protein YaaA, partial [Morganella morganii]|nr:peroxide stress protein YaaA [Morganella morganii]
QLTEFNLDGYRFDESQSGERELVFTRSEHNAA